MTQFEKALLSELKGIRKALEKLNPSNSVAIPAPSELLAMQTAAMQIAEKEKEKVSVDNIKIEIPQYDPLGRR